MWVKQCKWWKFDTAGWDARGQCMGRREADLSHEAGNAFALAARTNIAARWGQV